LPDIRDRVEEDRGLLKKIQLVIPGFRGYRIREDLRDSDRMLRTELNPMSKALEEMGGAVNTMKRVEGEILHAEVGYSGISADIKMEDQDLDRLYEYDNSMIESLNFIDEALARVPSLMRSGNDAELRIAVETVRARVDGLESRFMRRKATITGTGL
jgi:hypothetical protein